MKKNHALLLCTILLLSFATINCNQQNNEETILPVEEKDPVELDDNVEEIISVVDSEDYIKLETKIEKINGKKYIVKTFVVTFYDQDYLYKLYKLYYDGNFLFQTYKFNHYSSITNPCKTPYTEFKEHVCGLCHHCWQDIPEDPALMCDYMKKSFDPYITIKTYNKKKNSEVTKYQSIITGVYFTEYREFDKFHYMTKIIANKENTSMIEPYIGTITIERNEDNSVRKMTECWEHEGRDNNYFYREFTYYPSGYLKTASYTDEHSQPLANDLTKTYEFEDLCATEDKGEFICPSNHYTYRTIDWRANKVLFITKYDSGNETFFDEDGNKLDIVYRPYYSDNLNCWCYWDVDNATEVPLFDEDRD